MGIGLGMTDSAKARAPILAAGGIVLRQGLRPRIAVVQLRRDKAWVLPKGKLYPGEPALAAAKREVMEETGHKVSVREFLGAMSYTVNGKIKIVQFWHMRTVGAAAHELTNDVRAVKWLSLKQAIDTLTRTHEKIFLEQVGPIALKARKRTMRAKAARPTARNGSKRARLPDRLPIEANALARPAAFAHPFGAWIERLRRPSSRWVS